MRSAQQTRSDPAGNRDPRGTRALAEDRGVREQIAKLAGQTQARWQVMWIAATGRLSVANRTHTAKLTSENRTRLPTARRGRPPVTLPARYATILRRYSETLATGPLQGTRKPDADGWRSMTSGAPSLAQS
jgi:hypothetical protein